MSGIGKTIIKSNPILDSLQRGEPSLGTWISSASPVMTETQATAGWDWLLVDTEHSQVGFESMVNCFRAAQLGGCAPLARVPWNDTIWIQRALDAGAMGLVVPMVSNIEEAEHAVGNTVYAPHGNRSFGSSRLEPYLEVGYAAWCEENLAIIVQIETVEAVENLEEIVKVPGIRCCYVGPSDLLRSMDETSMAPGSAHDEAMQHIASVCRANGMPAGCWANDAADVNRRLAQGFLFMNCGSDKSHALASAGRELQAVERSIRP